MFDRFTDRARKVMGLSYQAAQRFDHDYIGTEHILLGVVEEGSGVAASVLKNLDVDLKRVRGEVERLVSTGSKPVKKGQLPFTPRAKRVLELSLEEAADLGHAYIGTEHLLLGLIQENEGIAAQVLRTLEVDVEEVRAKVIELLAQGPVEHPVHPVAGIARTPQAGSTLRIGTLFAPTAVTALEVALAIAVRAAVPVGPMHVLAGLLMRLEAETAVPFGNVDVVALTKSAVREASKQSSARTQEAGHTPESLRVLGTAMTRAASSGRSAATCQDLLFALVCDPDSPASAWLRAAGVDVERIRRA